MLIFYNLLSVYKCYETTKYIVKQSFFFIIISADLLYLYQKETVPVKCIPYYIFINYYLYIMVQV